MAISTAAAIIGSAIVGAGGAAYAGSQANKAASRGLAAQENATREQLALQKEQFDRVYGLNQPFVSGGYAAFDNLLREFGIAPSGGASAPGGVPAAPSTYRPPAPAPPASRPMLGSTPGGLQPYTPDPGPGPAPPGKRWVHGPEGYVLMDDRPSRSFGDVMGGPNSGRNVTPAVAPTAETSSGEGSSFLTGGAGGDMLGPSAPAAPSALAAPGSRPWDPGYVAPTSRATPATTSGGDFDEGSYLRANPDVQANFDRMMQTPEGREYFQSQGVASAEDAARLHYQQFGQEEGRNAPTTPITTTPATDATTDAAGRPLAPPPPSYDRPADSGPPPIGPRPTGGQRQDLTMGDYGSAPDLASFIDPKKFQEDPGYRYRMEQALKGVNIASAVRGKLRSGDAAQALASRSSDLASQEFNNWYQRQLQAYNATRQGFESDRGFQQNQFQYGQNRADTNFRYDTDRVDDNYDTDTNRNLNLWQYGQDRGDRNFADDRAYGTSMWQYGLDRGDRNFSQDRSYNANRYDTQTGNLFDLTRIGINAAGNISGAGSAYANNAGNAYGSQANAQADAAAARAAGNSQIAGGIAGAANNIFAAWGGGSRTPTAAPGSTLNGNWARGIW